MVCCARRRTLLVVGLCMSPISARCRSLYSSSTMSLARCRSLYSQSLDLSTIWPQCLQVAATSDSLSHSPSQVQIYDYLSLMPWVPICRLWVCTGVLIWAYFGGFVIWFWMGMFCGGSVVVRLLVAAMVEDFLFLFLFFSYGWWW